MNIFFESVDPDLMSIGQLIESLNYKPELEDVTHEFPLGISTYEDFKAYRTARGDNIVTFKKNNAYEIHHADENFVSGRIKSKEEQKKRNYTFVPTMFHVAKKLVDSGNSVRIIATSNNDGGDLIGKYHSLATRVMNDHKSFNVSELHQHNKDDKAYNSKGEELQFKEFYIKPNTTISEAIKILNKGIN